MAQLKRTGQSRVIKGVGYARRGVIQTVPDELVDELLATGEWARPGEAIGASTEPSESLAPVGAPDSEPEPGADDAEDDEPKDDSEDDAEDESEEDESEDESEDEDEGEAERVTEPAPAKPSRRSRRKGK